MKPLRGVRIVSLALNLPGPAALHRCHALGARCLKIEPPAGDPLRAYQPEAYADLHQGIAVRMLDLKSPPGRAALARALRGADVLLTSFRPSALARLGLGWQALHRAYPALHQVAIVGETGAAAEGPGHDLTYQAAHDLITGDALPPTLYADMGGALMASEAVLQAVLQQRRGTPGRYLEVALADAAQWLALPRHWGLTQATGTVGGAHAGYQVYRCRDGRVAVAALEPHFAAALCQSAGLPAGSDMAAPAVRSALARWMARQTRARLAQLAQALDLPLHTLPPA